MFSRRILTIGLILGIMVSMLASLSASAQTSVGTVTFRDSSASSDSAVIALKGMPAPSAGSHYNGWLHDSVGNKVDVGKLSVTALGTVSRTYVSPSGANLLADNQIFVITSEPSGAVVYADAIKTPAYNHVKTLVVGDDAQATALKSQAILALGAANSAKSASALADKQSYAQNAINILKLASSHADAVAATATLAKEEATTNATVVDNADIAIASVANIKSWAASATTAAQAVVDATADNAVVEVSINNLVNNASKVLNGRDVDTDGIVRPFAIKNASGVVTSKADEGGAKLAYSSSQDIAQFDLSAATAAPPVVGDALVSGVMRITLILGIVFLIAGGLMFRSRRAVPAS